MTLSFLASLLVALSSPVQGAESVDPPPSEEASPVTRLGAYEAGFRKMFDLALLGDLTARGNLDDAESASTIELGMIDFFVRANLAPRLSALSETMFGVHEGVSHVHVARLYVDWDASSFLRARVGQHDAPIGWYTTHFPHGGSVYRLAVDRPRMLSLTQGQEMLALHLIGGMVTGTARFEALDVSLDLSYGEDAIHFGASHSVKPMAARLSVSPNSGPSDLHLGVSAFVDRPHIEHFSELSHGAHGDEPTMPAEEADGHAHDNEAAAFVYREVYVAFAAYNAYPLDLNAEAYLTRHGDSLLQGGMLVAGHAFGPVAPYVRVHGFTRDADDPIYTFTAPEQYLDSVAGLRVSPSESTALKLEGGVDWVSGLPLAAAQAAVGF